MANDIKKAIDSEAIKKKSDQDHTYVENEAREILLQYYTKN